MNRKERLEIVVEVNQRVLDFIGPGITDLESRLTKLEKAAKQDTNERITAIADLGGDWHRGRVFDVLQRSIKRLEVKLTQLDEQVEAVASPPR